MSDSSKGAADTLEHLNTHSANFPQPPLLCRSQCCPCVQQSDVAAMWVVSGERLRALALVTGRTATERAVKATTRVRTIRMVFQDYPSLSFRVK
jgi:hypothetical protein